jgi:hypothetical protein
VGGDADALLGGQRCARAIVVASFFCCFAAAFLASIFFFVAGGWVGSTGSNNWPLRGSKVSDFEGGVRTVAFLTGGYLPEAVRGGAFNGFISIADW